MQTKEGIVYILEFRPSGTKDCTYFKVGVTKRSCKERMTQIMSSFINANGYAPYCKVIRSYSFRNPYKIEKKIKNFFKGDRSRFSHKFDGYTECYRTDTWEAVDLYDCLVRKDLIRRFSGGDYFKYLNVELHKDGDYIWFWLHGINQYDTIDGRNKVLEEMTEFVESGFDIFTDIETVRNNKALRVWRKNNPDLYNSENFKTIS